MDRIKERKPDIVGLSNYIWNLDLNKKISKYIKNIDKDIILVLGGPDFPNDKIEAEKYLIERENIDFYVLYQGEIGFNNIIDKYINDKNNLLDYDLENTARIKKGKLLINIKDSQYLDLNEVQSPYLLGLLDKFILGNLSPIIETNRGCPYKCTYCSWGRTTNHKLLKHPISKVLKEINYIGKLIKKSTLLFIADANFGIFDRDIKIAEEIKKVRDIYNYPRHIMVTNAKNVPNRIKKIGVIFKDMAQITLSFQSMDIIVQKHIKRENIPISYFKKLQDFFIGIGGDTYSELILGLPMETKHSHENGLRELLNYNTSIYCYNLQMLNGSEMNTPKQRELYDINTMYRLIDNGYGKYGDFISIESEKIVTNTSTMTKNDILYFRPIHWLIQFMWTYKYYKPLLYLLRENNINPYELIKRIVDDDSAIIKEFNYYANKELFSDKDELENYYKEEIFNNNNEYVLGKLNYKYTYKILLNNRDMFDDIIYKIIKDMYIDESQLNDIMKYLSMKTIRFSKLGNFDECKELKLNYDVDSWINNNYYKPLKYYKRNTKYKLYMSNNQLKFMKNNLDLYKQEDINKSLRKMAEYVNDKDFFYRVEKNEY